MGTWTFKAGDKSLDITAPTFEQASEGFNRVTGMKPAPQAGADKPQEQSTLDYMKGLGAQAAASIPTGAAYFAGLPGAIGDYLGDKVDKGIRYAAGVSDAPQLTPEEYSKASPEDRKKSTIKMPRSPFSSGAIADTLHKAAPFTAREPTNRSEKFVRTVGENVAPAIATGGTGVMNMLFNAVIPGVASEGASQALEKANVQRPSWMPDWVPTADTIARLGASVIAPAGVRKVITPGKNVTAPRQAAKETLDDIGVPTTAGAVTNDTKLRYAEEAAGFDTQAQTDAFTKAALKKIGIDDTSWTPQNMQKAGEDLGQGFNDLAANNRLVPNRKLRIDIDDAEKWYNGKVAPGNRSPGVQEQIDNIRKATRTGQISGDHYQNMVTELRLLGEGADGATIGAVRKLRNALDDAMETSIARFNPQDLGKWAAHRSAYRDYIVLEDVAARAGAADGSIPPHLLANSLIKQGGSRQYVRGNRDLAEMAQAGRLLMRPLPSSGTTERLLSRLGLAASKTSLGTGVGAGIGAMAGGPIGAAIGGGIGAMAYPAAAALKHGMLLSKPGQAYFGNQLIPKGSLPAYGTGGLLGAMGAGDSNAPDDKKKKKGGK